MFTYLIMSATDELWLIQESTYLTNDLQHLVLKLRIILASNYWSLEMVLFWRNTILIFENMLTRVQGGMSYYQEIKLLFCFQKQDQKLQTLSTILNLKIIGHFWFRFILQPLETSRTLAFPNYDWFVQLVYFVSLSVLSQSQEGL